MNRYFIKKAVAAALFMCILFLGMYGNLTSSGTVLISTIKDMAKEQADIKELIEGADDVINEYAYGKYVCLDSYGMMQLLLGKNEENDFEVVKDKNGMLHYTYFSDGAKDMMKLATVMKDYSEAVCNADVLYVMTPDKAIEGKDQFDAGLPYHYSNEEADAFLKIITDAGVNALDYRDFICAQKLSSQELFFRTDHHWRIETAFWAYRTLLTYIEEQYGYVLDPEGLYTEIENYNQLIYEDCFIGSMARKTGIYYGGVDDFTILYPKFTTDFNFYAVTNDIEISTQGRFEYSLLNMEPWYYTGSRYDIQNDKYSTYLYGNHGLVHITNNRNIDGPKILIVKDSFMVPVAAFLANVCSEVYLIDPRYYDGNITAFTNSIDDLSLAIVSFSPQNLTEEFLSFE